MEEYSLNVNLHLESTKCMEIKFTTRTTVESICLDLCERLKIGPVARHLFSLRINQTSIFLANYYTLFSDSFKNGRVGPSLDLRIRYKPASIQELKKLDASAFEYYYLQVRDDIIQGLVPGLAYDDCQPELTGLCITDMFRYMLENSVPMQAVERDHKKFMSKEIVKKHRFFLSTPIHENLKKLNCNMKDRPNNISFIKEQYLLEVENRAPCYLQEIHEAMLDRTGPDGDQSLLVNIKVTPPHGPDSGIKYCTGTLKKKYNPNWTDLCTIEELGFIAFRDDCSVELSRLNGIPIYIRFKSNLLMLSFVSLLDGYYRLSCKWTFNLCQKLRTESLSKLYWMKCHGPVGGRFSYHKLEIKASNQVGSYIIRESESSYSTYYIDVCVKSSSKPISLKVSLVADGYMLEGNATIFDTMQSLIKAYKEPDGEIYFKECIPPSDFDVSQLLLCKLKNDLKYAVGDSSDLMKDNTSPVCVPLKDLEIYGVPRMDGSRQLTHVFRGIWKARKGWKAHIALKFLNEDKQSEFLKEYMRGVGEWSFLNCPNLVRFFGVCFSMGSTAPLMEYCKLGRLDEYLKANKLNMKQFNLIEACVALALALWHLHENNMIHGRVRCRKLMVYQHNEKGFIVKLTDGGVNTPHVDEDIHWTAPECYITKDRRSPEADIWALATTFYEIFTWGEPIPTHRAATELMKWYESGHRLSRPIDCPEEVYNLMIQAWIPDPQLRKKTQELSRDMNQLAYQLFNDSHERAYELVSLPTRSASAETIDSSMGSGSASDDSPYETHIGVINVNFPPSVDDTDSDSSQQRLLDSPEGEAISLTSSEETSRNAEEEKQRYLASFDNLNVEESPYVVKQPQTIYPMDSRYNLCLGNRLGQGFYGDVCKGYIEDTENSKADRLEVAVKKLKPFAQKRFKVDFEREISIMHTLRHPNVVQIYNVIRVPEILLVMELVPHGSLQSYLSFNKDNLTAMNLLKFACDIARGMEYLRQKHIVHRDLAARNILVVDHDNVKISDFGLAQVVDSNDYYMLRTLNRSLPIKWYAPESLTHGKFSTKSDVWSYGITVYEIYLFGKEPPFLGGINDQNNAELQATMMAAITSGERYPCPEGCAQSVYVNVIRPCWEMDPHARPTFKELTERVMTEMFNSI